MQLEHIVDAMLLSTCSLAETWTVLLTSNVTIHYAGVCLKDNSGSQWVNTGLNTRLHKPIPITEKLIVKTSRTSTIAGFIKH